MKTVSGKALVGIANQEVQSGHPSQRSVIPTPALAHDIWTSSTLPHLIKTVSSAGVVFVFGLYAFGYVIWNSDLGRFGLRTNTFLSFDYIAAAMRYLMFISAVAFPIWFVLYTITDDLSVSGHPMTERLWAIVIISYAVMYEFKQLFFPDRQAHLSWLIDGVLLGILCVHLGLLITISKLGKAARLREILTQRIFFASYLTVWSYAGFLREPNVDISFVFSTCLIYVTATNLIGTRVEMQRLKEHLKHPGVQALVLVLFACAALANASQFGKKQFALLPQTVGGGRPMTALLKSSFFTEQLANQFKLPVSGQFIGPVLLLYESDSNVCFTTKENFMDPKKGAFAVKRDAVEVIATISPNEDLLSTSSGPPEPTVVASPGPTTSATPVLSVPTASASPVASTPSSDRR